jgi:hypothetical protein
MGLDLEIIIGIVVLTVLGVFLTGPGMWSEKWGWSTLRRKKRAMPGGDPPRTRGDARSGAPPGAQRYERR